MKSGIEDLAIAEQTRTINLVGAFRITAVLMPLLLAQPKATIMTVSSGLAFPLIQQLPVEFREMIILREYEELSYKEIASLLDCPPGAVMSRLARARSKLRDLLSDGLMAPWEKEIGETNGTAA